MVSEYPKHVGDVPRSHVFSFLKSVAMINKENLPPSSGLADVDTTQNERRASKRRRSGDQTTTNQGRPPLILMDNFNNVAIATPGDTLSAEKGGGARTSVPVPLAPASDSRSDAETTKVQELTEALEKLQLKVQLQKDKFKNMKATLSKEVNTRDEEIETLRSTIGKMSQLQKDKFKNMKATLSKEVNTRDEEIETLRSTIGKMSWKQLVEDEEFRNKRFPKFAGFLNGDCVIALWNIFYHYVPVYDLLPVYFRKYRDR
jgi:hypothetical protein